MIADLAVLAERSPCVGVVRQSGNKTTFCLKLLMNWRAAKPALPRQTRSVAKVLVGWAGFCDGIATPLNLGLENTVNDCCVAVQTTSHPDAVPCFGVLAGRSGEAPLPSNGDRHHEGPA
jgi:hypothetical protein